MTNKIEENERQYRVIDQMLSMHSSARDEYKLKSQILDICLLFFSVFTCALLLSEPKLSQLLNVPENLIEILTAIFSVIVLFLSLLENKLNWKELISFHQIAINKLSDLKNKYRNAFKNNEKIDFTEIYDAVMKDIIDIPESKFLKYKARHLYKRKVSMEMSKNPGISLTLLRIKLKLGCLDNVKKDRQCN